MYKALLAGSPLLSLPLVALFIFLVVFVTVVIKTMMKKAAAYAVVADLPLAEEEARDEH